MNVLRPAVVLLLPLVLAACQTPVAQLAPAVVPAAEPAPRSYVSDFEGLLQGRQVGGGVQIFLRYEGIDGDATEESHRKWIALEGVQLRASRTISPLRGASSREASEPQLDGLMILKNVDRATPLLFRESTAGYLPRRAEVQFVSVGIAGQTFLSLTLTDTLVKNWEITNKENGLLLESMVLDFTRIEMRYTPFDERNKPTGSVTVGWDILTSRGL